MRRLDKLIEIISIVLVIDIVFVVSLQVVLRYVFSNPLVWVEEWTRYSLVWLTFFGSFLALRKKKHIKVEIVYRLQSDGIRRIMDIIGEMAIAIFSIYMIIYGFSYTFKLMSTWPESFRIPMGIFYMIVPLAGLLFVVYSLGELWIKFIKPLSKLRVSSNERRNI